MFKNHIYANNQAEAIKLTRSQYPNLSINSAYLDPDWHNPKRWCIEVGNAIDGDAAEAIRQADDHQRYLRETGDAT